MMLGTFAMSAADSVDYRDTYVHDILAKLGISLPSGFELINNKEVVAQGEELFFKGQVTNSDGTKTAKISNVFTCNHCHNNTEEDPNLSISDPQARLDFAVKKKIPFLQGTTMYGTSNRETWFNDDYLKKYGQDLIGPARNSLRGAIRLCSKECSMGRDLETWEENAFMAYFYSISLKLSDLKLSSIEMEKINNLSRYPSDEVKAIIQSKYLKASPATFVEPPIDGTSYGNIPNPINGAKIFTKSCLHCHGTDTTVKFIKKFKNKKSTFKYLSRFKNNYKVIRHGIEKEKSYMPLYPIQKMSHQQVDDLKSYIDQQSKSFTEKE
jgi:mono/diheme cytochrome c family protein